MDLLVWESRVAPLQRLSRHAYTLYGTLALAWVLVVAFAEWRLIETTPMLWAVLSASGIYALLTIILWLSWMSSVRMFDKSYRAAAQALAVSIN